MGFCLSSFLSLGSVFPSVSGLDRFESCAKPRLVLSLSFASQFQMFLILPSRYDSRNVISRLRRCDFTVAVDPWLALTFVILAVGVVSSFRLTHPPHPSIMKLSLAFVTGLVSAASSVQAGVHQLVSTKERWDALRC